MIFRGAKMKKRVLLMGFSLTVLLGLGDFYLYPHGLQTFKMKQIHDILYNTYFPEDSLLTATQRAKRFVYKNLMWFKVKANPQIEAILSPLVDFKANLPPKIREDFKDVVHKGLNNVTIDRVEELRREIMRQAPIDVQRKILIARQAWLYLIYSTPLAKELAGLQPAPIIKGIDINPDLPASRLFIDRDQIKHQDGEIDYLIIGSGPAGSVIAHELARQRKVRVVLVESGSFVKPLCKKTEFDPNLMESHNHRRTPSGGIIIRNGHAVGGGTTVNIDLAFSPLLPQIQQKFQSWVDAGHLPADFFHHANQDWGKLQQAYNWVTAHVHTRQVDLSEINQNNRLLLEGTPLARTYDLNARPPHGKHDILKISAVEAFLLPALQRKEGFKGELSLISDAEVLRVEIENQGTTKSGTTKSATGVHLSFTEPHEDKCVIKDSNHLKPAFNKTYVLKAKTIILCAGALGSAGILLKSKLMNDHIGRGVIIHPSMGAIGTFFRDINVLEGLSASVYAPASDGSYIFEAMAAEPNFIAAIHPGSGHDILNTIRHFKKLGGFGVMLVDTPSPDNRVMLNPQTKKLEIFYELSNEDKKRMKEGLSEALKILLRQGAQNVFLPSSEMIYEGDKFSPMTSPDRVDSTMDKLLLQDGFNVISSAHMQGTNKLNKDPKQGVASPRFRVWDSEHGLEFANFYVCDSSVFPTSVGANPMQSIYAIAKLFTDQVLLKPDMATR
jgi:choline dehydrogenase-like flavoprotein